MDTNTISRAQLRRIFRRHYGEAAKLARELGVAPSSVALWFKDRFDSKRVEAAIRARAAELLATETASETAA